MKATELRQRILDEMNSRRIDGKTYIDSEWLLNEYDKTERQKREEEVEAERERILQNINKTTTVSSGLENNGVTKLGGLPYTLTSSEPDHPTDSDGNKLCKQCLIVLQHGSIIYSEDACTKHTQPNNPK